MGNTRSYEERIDRAHKTGILGLRGAGLKKVPLWLSEVLTADPSTLSPLLKSLDLGQNRLTEAPLELLERLPNLKHLILAQNRLLGSITLEFVAQKLETLDLEGNQLEHIAFRQDMPLLKQLKVAKNQLRALDGLERLPILVTLDLSYNKLAILPANVTRLTALQELTVSNNQLIDLPDNIGDLKELTLLDVRHNQLRSLPSSLFTHTQLKALDVLEGNLLTPTRLQDIDGYDDFLQRRKGRVDQLLK